LVYFSFCLSAAAVVEVEGLGRSKRAWAIWGTGLTWLIFVMAMLHHLAIEAAR